MYDDEGKESMLRRGLFMKAHYPSSIRKEKTFGGENPSHP